MNNSGAAVIENIEGHIQLLSAALSASISGIIITDYQQRDNPIIFCNRAFEQMTGYTAGEVLGKNCRFLQGEDKEQIGRYKLKEALSAKKECYVELVNYRKDRTIFYNELYLAPIKDNMGIVTHYIGIQNDITVRKQKEISLQLELKLQQQKDEFTNLASHELRTPITSLRATIQLMNRIIQNEPIPNDPLVTLSNNAERYTKKLSLLVDDLLVTTVLTNEELVLNKTAFIFSEVTEGCCHHVLMNGTHHIRKTGDPFMEVYGDQHKLDQVMINLIDNAVKFAPQSKEIIVGAERTRNLVKVSVTDKGIGVTKEQLPYIFLRYKKADHNLANQSGFGLGLFICSEIVRSHGGEMGVESEPGKGSTFWFTLPDQKEGDQ